MLLSMEDAWNTKIIGKTVRYYQNKIGISFQMSAYIFLFFSLCRLLRLDCRHIHWRYFSSGFGPWTYCFGMPEIILSIERYSFQRFQTLSFKAFRRFTTRNIRTEKNERYHKSEVLRFFQSIFLIV